MKTTESNYNISKDYDLLHSLIEKGLMLVCFVDYKTNRFDPENNFIDRDIAIIRIDGRRYQIGVRGTGYEDYIEAPNKAKFYEMCQKSNLTFIQPNKELK